MTVCFLQKSFSTLLRPTSVPVWINETNFDRILLIQFLLFSKRNRLIIGCSCQARNWRWMQGQINTLTPLIVPNCVLWWLLLLVTYLLAWTKAGGLGQLAVYFSQMSMLQASANQNSTKRRAATSVTGWLDYWFNIRTFTQRQLGQKQKWPKWV